jgi:hypothetical protein
MCEHCHALAQAMGAAWGRAWAGMGAARERRPARWNPSAHAWLSTSSQLEMYTCAQAMKASSRSMRISCQPTTDSALSTKLVKPNQILQSNPLP